LYSLQNETYYRGLGVTSYYQDKYEGSQTHLEKLAVKSMMLQSSLEPVYQIIVWFDLIFVLWLGGGRVIDKTWLLGDFSAYLTTFMLIATKASRIGKLFNSYQGLKVSWERCRIYMKFPEQTEEKSQLDASGLEIKNLSFGFKPEETLKNISFSARPGEIVGICGRVHSGKSTLLQAINGLYEYSGSATLGGVETKKIRQEELDGLIGFCSSSSQIYQDTIQNNISLGRSESIDEALHLSHLEDEVKDMDINLTRSVANLSGGQQKRLMIARAVYRSPRLIMLDNPFESIDEPMSLEILTLTRSSLKNSVVLLVSNQENILRCCDKLLYLKDYSGTFSTYEDLRGDEDFETFLGGVPK
jgi:ABC-type multidrug transport system fused ATPase/permease subunit